MLQPTLTKTLGFGYVPTLLMSAPPWVFSCIFSVCVAYSSDKFQEKVSLKRPSPAGTTKHNKLKNIID
jgi:hypothetical protein